jgi:transcriptional regulator with XRE-family HTH domain
MPKVQVFKVPLTSSAKLAELSGGRQQWNDIESGRRKNLTIDTLNKIATALGVKAKDLLK